MEPGAPLNDSIPRMFVVGMNKTGTSTMKGCFEALGWLPVASPTTTPGAGQLTRQVLASANYAPALEVARHYMSFEDRPWNVWEMYRHLAERFPDGKFILTLREPQAWWKSVNNWLTVRKPNLVEIYMTHLRAGAFTESDFINGFEQHNQSIMRFFEGTDRLLTLDVTTGDGWEEICPFLGVPIPDLPFPHRNKQGYR